MINTRTHSTPLSFGYSITVDEGRISSAHARVPITMSPARADLAVTLGPGSFDATPQPLDAIDQTITVTNLGPSVAAPVTIARKCAHHVFQRVR